MSNPNKFTPSIGTDRGEQKARTQIIKIAEHPSTSDQGLHYFPPIQQFLDKYR